MELLAALELFEAGKLEDAHKIVQADSSVEAAGLHGLIHRMEGDTENALYWFRRAGFPSPPEDAEVVAEIRGKHGP